MRWLLTRRVPAHGLPPKCIGDLKRIEIALLPPLPFLARGVNAVVVNGAERNSEFIAHFHTEPARLRVAHMMSVGG